MPDLPRLTRLDETHRDLHTHIAIDDECYFFFEYTAHRNYSYGSTNNLISNLKKSPLTKGTNQHRYKLAEIRNCASLFSAGLSSTWLEGAVLVPVPPSKMRGDPAYDDRMTQICAGIVSSTGRRADVREIVVQTTSMEAAHVSSGARPTVAELLSVYQIDESHCAAVPGAIGIVDDVLTAGTHFRAMHTILSRRFPSLRIVGFFIARRIFPPEEAGNEFAFDL